MEDKANQSAQSVSEGEEYLRSLINGEAREILADLQSAVENEESAEGLAPLIHRLSLILASLSARVSVVEKALERHLTPASVVNHKYLIGELELSAVDVHDASQFHEIEVAEGGSRFAWTNRKDVVFYLPVTRTRPKRLTLVAIAIVDPDYARQFECTIDGKPQACKVDTGGGEISVHVDLPVSDDIGVSEVVFSLPDVHSPGSSSGVEDARLLGFAFKSLAVGAAEGRGGILSGLFS